MIILLTVGLPGSGKSTWAKKYVKNHLSYIECNRDEVRLKLFQRTIKLGSRKESLVSLHQDTDILQGIKNGKNVIISDTNLDPKIQQTWINFAQKYGLKLKIKDFRHVPVETCIERDSGRQKPTGKKEIMARYEKFLNSTQLL